MLPTAPRLSLNPFGAGLKLILLPQSLFWDDVLFEAMSYCVSIVWIPISLVLVYVSSVAITNPAILEICDIYFKLIWDSVPCICLSVISFSLKIIASYYTLIKSLLTISLSILSAILIACLRYSITYLVSVSSVLTSYMKILFSLLLWSKLNEFHGTFLERVVSSSLVSSLSITVMFSAGIVECSDYSKRLPALDSW